MSVTEQSADTPECVSPGRLLAEARERAHLTHEQVASALHMTVSKVRAIELDEYSKLNVETYIRGYLRSYSALVKIDSAPVLAAYEKLVVSGGCSVPKADYVVRAPAARKGFGFIAVILGLLALLLLISVWFFGNRIPSDSPRALPVIEPVAAISSSPVSTNIQTASPVVVEDAETDAAPVSNPSATTEEEVLAPVPDAENDVSSAPAVIAPLTATEVQTASQSQLDHLYLVFSEECWLEVSDAQGDVLATDLHRPGSRLALVGQAPFKVKLGNVRAATITLNNQPVTVTPPPGVSVYSFTVGQ